MRKVVISLALVACGSKEAPPKKHLPKDAPTTTPDSLRATRVKIGEHYACALTASGEVGCWGQLDQGQPRIDVPIRQKGVTDAVALTVSDWQTCVRHHNGPISCWTARAPLVDLEEGDPAMARPQVPTTPARCTRQRTEVSCTPADAGSGAPAKPFALAGPAADLSCSDIGCCAVLTDGSVWCWSPIEDRPNRVPGFGPPS